MTDSYRSELQDLIDRAFVGEYAGRATAQMVYNSIYSDLPPHLIDHLVGKGIKAEIGSYFRAKGIDGLPMRPKVNAEGEHADFGLLSPEEMAYLYQQYVDASAANDAQAEKVRAACLKKYSVDLAATASAGAA